MTPDQKGSIAEAAIVCAAIRLGIGVLKPVGDGERYDLIFDLRPRLIRIQCKWAIRRGDVVVVRCYSCRRTRAGMLGQFYTPEQIDAFAAYCAEVDQCWLLPIGRFPRTSATQLRLAPARNNQRLGINWAEDFEFERLNWAELGP